MPSFPRALPALAAAAMASSALAGGSPEHVLLIINPAHAESMYLGHYYKHARNIPDANVLYLDPGAASYAQFAGPNGGLDGFFGALRNGALSHIDYVVVANTRAFYISAPGYVTDGCWPVARFSQSSVFTLANQRDQILAGNVPSTILNHYYSVNTNQPLAFSSATRWAAGSPTPVPTFPRYFIGASLGYTGTNGNTVADLLTMIDRSVQADGAQTAGAFYFMSTSDPLRNVRAAQFPAASAAITSRGGTASTLSGVLPENHNDCLGIVTGWADPDIDGAPMTLLPGAFADHLTSWAATFDINNQTKISAWIRRGASGSAGTVEEPCNYPGKFPHTNLHAFYFQGLSLGEAYFRSLGHLPFQGLFIGDPLTRPFAVFPSVVATIPSGPVSGTISFTPIVSTTLPGAQIAQVELYIDGVLHSARAPGEPFTVHTAALPDGWHDLRILAYDNTPVRNTGRWIGTLTTANAGRAASLSLNTSTGDMTTLFEATLAGSGAPVAEVRLVYNGRVVAAAPSGSATVGVYGRNLGAGEGNLHAEALFADGRTARSAPVPITVDYAVSTFSGEPPIAYSYTKHVARGGPFVVELPASFDDGLVNVEYTIVSPPSQGTTVGEGVGPYRVMTAASGACGPDQFTFRVTTPSGQSNLATVTLIYDAGPGCPADASGDGNLNINDFVAFQNLFAAGDLRADLDGSCDLSVNDFVAFSNAFVVGCP